jgi:hypothetical protein
MRSWEFNKKTRYSPREDRGKGSSYLTHKNTQGTYEKNIDRGKYLVVAVVDNDEDYRI